MTLFNYKATDQTGKIVTGTQDASDEKGVVASLQARGYIPIRITSSAKVSSQLSIRWGKSIFGMLKKVSNKDILRCTEDLATLLGAGLTLDRSLQILRDAADKQALTSLLAEVLKAVEKGSYLSDALANHPKQFSQFYVNMVKAGEAGGFLDLILERMSLYLRDTSDLKEYIVSAMIYPLFLLCISGISIIVLLTYVTPKFAVIFADLGQAIPLSTQVLLSLAAFFQKYVLLLLIIFVALIFFWRRFSKTSAGRYRLDSFLTSLPVAGAFIQELETARFARTLGTLIKSGVPILGSLTLVQGVIRNRVIAESLEVIRERVREGEALSKPLADNDRFPKLAIQMITVGEETGRLDEMLFKIGDIYEKKVRNFIKKGMSLMEPAVILIMGIIIGFIVISMLMAIFSMNDLPF
ncbi:MAG: type II secretion system F family protein [Deltaproteobacteria bacterium]|nr:type II secretion system F family protein [Deltaproteobacteria bacterium]